MASFSLRQTTVAVDQELQAAERTVQETKLADDAKIQALRAVKAEADAKFKLDLAKAERLAEQHSKAGALAIKKQQVKKKYYHAKKKAEADQKKGEFSY
jgi:hypothetical protein